MLVALVTRAWRTVYIDGEAKEGKENDRRRGVRAAVLYGWMERYVRGALDMPVTRLLMLQIAIRDLVTGDDKSTACTDRSELRTGRVMHPQWIGNGEGCLLVHGA